MKKVLVIGLVLVMILCMGANVLAARGGFVSSPSENPAPVLVSFTPGNRDCTAELIITPYSDKEELPGTLLSMMNRAYSEILNSDDLTKLNADLAALAASKNLDGKRLAVSDLFDIRVTGCDYHEDHLDFEITLDADTLSRFVGLLHMKHDGQWELISNAQVVHNGEHLKFSVETLSPFAIVIETDFDSEDLPHTGDDSNVGIYAIIMAVSAIALIVIAVTGKKKKKD